VSGAETRFLVLQKQNESSYQKTGFSDKLLANDTDLQGIVKSTWRAMRWLTGDMPLFISRVTVITSTTFCPKAHGSTSIQSPNRFWATAIPFRWETPKLFFIKNKSEIQKYRLFRKRCYF